MCDVSGWRIRKQFFPIKPTDPTKKDVRNILTWVWIIDFWKKSSDIEFLVERGGGRGGWIIWNFLHILLKYICIAYSYNIIINKSMSPGPLNIYCFHRSGTIAKNKIIFLLHSIPLKFWRKHDCYLSQIPTHFGGFLICFQDVFVPRLKEMIYF